MNEAKKREAVQRLLALIVEVSLLLSMWNLNFRGYLISRIFITCKISEIKSLAKWSGFTVWMFVQWCRRGRTGCGKKKMLNFVSKLSLVAKCAILMKVLCHMSWGLHSRPWARWNKCQWHNRQGGRGAQYPPETSDQEIFADVSPYRGKRGKEKREKGWKLRRKGGKLEMEAGKRYKRRWVRTFFFFFSLFTLENDENLFWVYQKYVYLWLRTQK